MSGGGGVETNSKTAKSVVLLFYSIIVHGTKKHWGSGMKFIERNKRRKLRKENRKGKRDGNQKRKIFQRKS
jgi:hypothetical protein